MPLKVCFYEILQVNRDADVDTIKKAYRRLALALHPDKQALKSPEDSEKAKIKFQAVVEAYEVLSDPNEKAWYDSHRDQILRGEEAGQTRDFLDELMRYFSTSSFGNAYDDGPKHFYRVYDQIFANISAYEDHEFPAFGSSKLDNERLLSFYRQWGVFASTREFAECDKWNLAQADSRQVKRAMDAENKKLRAEAKREFSDTVRKLVDFVKKRDPRLVAYRARKAQEDQIAAARQAQAQAEAKIRKAAERECARLEEERRWQEIDGMRNRNASDEQEETGKGQSKPLEIYECLACRKSFKSEKMFQNHEQSKKHKDAIAAILKELGHPFLRSSPVEVEVPAAPVLAEEPVPEPAKGDEIPSELSSERGEAPEPSKQDAEIPSEEGEGVREEESASEPESPVLKTERNKLKREQMKQALRSGPPAEEKKPRRRRDKTKDAVAGSTDQPGLVCIKCKQKFASKTALFKHLEDSGHAAPK